jgi:signal transduction histidine kinase
MPADEEAGPRGPRGSLVIAFVVVAVSFILATAFSQFWALQIDSQALEITGDAAPSILCLSSARTDLRSLQVELLAQQRALEDHRPVHAEAVQALRVHLDQDVQTYVKLPFFPGERELWRNVQKQLDVFDVHVKAAARQLALGHPAELRALLDGDFHHAVDHLSDALRLSLEFNARHAAQLAASIGLARRRSGRVAVGLDAVCLVATVVAALAVLRAVRSHQQLVRAHNQALTQKAEELETFAGRVAHDVLSPLSTVGLTLDMASPQVNERLGRQLGRARAAVSRIKSMVNDLLAFARAGAGPANGEVAVLGRVLEDLRIELEPTAAEAGITLTIEPAPEVTLECSPGVLTSIVANLMRNAIKYLGEQPVRQVTVKSTVLPGALHVEVRDTGPGIPAELVPVVFVPHVRGHTDRPGLGLGLATVKRLIDAHGGRVGVESEVGRGSCFWFELPLPAQPAELPG